MTRTPWPPGPSFARSRTLGISRCAQREQRAVVTENIDDFSRIADTHDRGGQTHHGLVLLHPQRHPRGNPRTIGRMVTALERLLHERPGTTPTSLRHWL